MNAVDYRSYLNKFVRVSVDRPMGSKHPVYDMIYPVNYGFIPNTKAPDGEEIDVYVLGVSAPTDKFSGRCIAIIHRLDDDDDKLVVVPDGTNYTNAQIKDLTDFQEKFFTSEIIRK